MDENPKKFPPISILWKKLSLRMQIFVSQEDSYLMGVLVKISYSANLTAKTVRKVSDVVRVKRCNGVQNRNKNMLAIIKQPKKHWIRIFSNYLLL